MHKSLIFILPSLLVSFGESALAQAAEPTPTPPAPVQPTPVQPPTAQPVPATAAAPSATAPTTPAVAPTAAKEEKAPEAPPEEPWYKKISVGAFVDAYASLNYNLPRQQADANTYHPYDSNAGFGLAWVGLDASLAPDPIGGAISLRFGPGVKNLALSDYTAPGGIGFLQNAYVSWKPDGKDGHFTLLGGKFDTLYGAEVAASQLNINYTRGVLYNLAQPFFHTGLRLDAQFGGFTLKAMAVNGWNNTIDNNIMKSFGLQASYNANDKVTVSLGYLGGPEGNDTQSTPGGAGTSEVPGANGRWRHMADLVVDAKPTPELHLMLNGTFVADKMANDETATWFGVSAMGRYSITEIFGVGGRFEALRDTKGAITAPNAPGNSMSLITGTLTFEALATKYLVFRLDNRVDYATESVFTTRDSSSKSQITTTLGIVAKTN
jgi:Putative beta-barrel porin-2, OmpL-like. bbp2